MARFPRFSPEDIMAMDVRLVGFWHRQAGIKTLEEKLQMMAAMRTVWADKDGFESAYKQTANEINRIRRGTTRAEIQQQNLERLLKVGKG